MRSRYRISLGGVHLDSIDNDLLILDIGYTTPEPTAPQNKVADLDGLEYGDEYFRQQTVTVTFELHIYDVQTRNAVCQKVNEWAKAGGTLVTNDRAGQRLWNVKCQKYASIESARNWTDPLTLVFVSTYLPYWVSNTEKTLSLSGKSAKGKLKLDGNVSKAKVNAVITAAANITSFQITVGDTTLKLTGLSLASGKELVIDHVRKRYLRIMADGKSVMSQLDASSADDLLAVCGEESSVSFSANNKVTAKITARGLWL